MTPEREIDERQYDWLPPLSLMAVETSDPDREYGIIVLPQVFTRYQGRVNATLDWWRPISQAFSQRRLELAQKFGTMPDVEHQALVMELRREERPFIKSFHNKLVNAFKAIGDDLGPDPVIAFLLAHRESERSSYREAVIRLLDIMPCTIGEAFEFAVEEDWCEIFVCLVDEMTAAGILAPGTKITEE